jgi:hypothetical protein
MSKGCGLGTCSDLNNARYSSCLAVRQSQQVSRRCSSLAVQSAAVEEGS